MSTIQKKKISQGLQKLIDKANEYHEKASEVIKEAYDYAVNIDGLTPKEARVVLYNTLSYSPQWIRNHIPDEAKDISKRNISLSDKKTKKDAKVVSHHGLNSSPQKDEPPVVDEISSTVETTDDDTGEQEQEQQPDIMKFISGINSYLEGITGHELTEEEEHYHHNHITHSKEYRKNIIKKLEKEDADTLGYELLLIQIATEETLKLLRRRNKTNNANLK